MLERNGVMIVEGCRETLPALDWVSIQFQTQRPGAEFCVPDLGNKVVRTFCVLIIRSEMPACSEQQRQRGMHTWTVKFV